MSKATDLIERYFQSFINEQDPNNFYLLMADYIKAVQETPEAISIVKKLEKQRLEEYSKLQKLEDVCVKELEKPVNAVLDAIEAYSKLDGVNKAMQQLKNYVDGKVSNSEPHPIALEHYLYDIVIENGSRYSNQLPFLEKFTDQNRYPQNIYGNYTFTKSIGAYSHARGTIRKNNELWNAWYHLTLVNKAINKGERMANALLADISHHNQRELDEGVDYLHVYNDWRKIAQYKEHQNIFNPRDMYYLKPPEYKLYANRFHNHLIKELGKFPEHETTAPKPVISFDSDESTLHFQGKAIAISKSKNTDPHYLLQSLFSDPKKVWSYDEIAIDWETEFDKNQWKRFYNAAHSVNKKVATKTGIEDFLEASKMSANINKKYLPK